MSKDVCDQLFCRFLRQVRLRYAESDCSYKDHILTFFVRTLCSISNIYTFFFTFFSHTFLTTPLINAVFKRVFATIEQIVKLGKVASNNVLNCVSLKKNG